MIAATCAAAHAQYPGHIKKDADTTPTLRATGVFEWTGDLDQPKAGRLIPLTVWDGQQYQPGGLYLAQPAPLTVLTGTVYELEQAGTPKGLFNVNGAENLEGSWIAVGSVKPEVMKVKAKPPMSKHPPQVVKDTSNSEATTDSDRPTLHRKDGSDSGSGSGSSNTTSGNTPTGNTGGSNTTASNTGSGNGSSNGSGTPSSDPDKPTLHRRDSSDSSSGSGSSSDSTSTSNAPTDESDKPTLHRKDSGDNSQDAPAPDPDRPTLHKHRDAANADGTVSFPADPDRPKLRYGRPQTPEESVVPTKLEGLPMDMNQMAAISDVKTTELHPYTYSWADPEDAAKMKAAMEEQAQKAIAAGFTTQTPQANVTKTATKTTATRRKAAPPPQLPTLEDEKFNAFELSYNGGATLVLTAKSTGADGEAKYITLVAQPDFYGTPHVIFKQLTSDKALDIVPRMRLVDVADTDGDGRAELIFEQRGKTGRSFGIYRLSSGRVLEAFNTGPLP
ncbi:hypothetical protein H7849_18570 [Alloacidobacterium dinghuense]|uniref:Uncharacterized protein n=1 Tax=Alloacidobacterium dinghuense TaxID=2763107 RepID=A0A7G8BEX1_9BACT|nr:hypothetical protein [Alloacidobacterium dinghuense]QNI31091.1 hypothetical protein H7849_18570 [Alloacidobacterium dinghuense]